MNSIKLPSQQPSVFAQMVDSLRTKSEQELKVLYLRFFKKELQEEWKNIVKDSDLKKFSEKEIIEAIQKNRYRQ